VSCFSAGPSSTISQPKEGVVGNSAGSGVSVLPLMAVAVLTFALMIAA
jgi:hypothetical protein